MLPLQIVYSLLYIYDMGSILKFIRYVILFFFASSIFFVLIYKWLPVPFTPLMVIRSVEHKVKGEPASIHHKWVPLNEISPYLPVAVIASEDQNFLHHHGFDFDAIEDAAIQRVQGKRRRGGSTISQQTAKNVFLWPTSSWVRKGFEAYFTVLIELFWSKERIMEVYLNSIEMGNNLYGAQAVAYAHFGCTAKDLRRSDCALIAATLPNPIKFSSLSPSAYMRKRQKQIQHEMRFIPFLKK